MNNIDYTLWPNTDGNLGNIKVQIPTGIGDDKWPEGDVLVGNFVYKDGKLAGFVDTKALIVNDSKSTIINYDYIDIELPFTEGEVIITRGERSKYFNIRYLDSNDNGNDNDDGNDGVITLKYKSCKTVQDVMAVDPDYLTNDIIDGIWAESLADLEIGYYKNSSGWPPTIGMFKSCSNLTSFSSDLSSLTDGNYMFHDCTNLTSFTSDLSSLTDGEYMFYNCTKLESFSSNLPSLTDGTMMFYNCTKLESFSSDLSSLTNGSWMFQCCTKLESFSSDLSSLTNGYSMFDDCSKLTSFSSDLSSLTDGKYMFSVCKLDAPSVKNIIDTINTSSKGLTLGMGCDNTETDKNLFAQEVGYTDMTSLLTALSDKGWTVTAQYIGRPTTTYSLRRPSEDTLPVFVKLEETEEYADYTSEDGSKKFRLDWFHETTGSTEGYTQYATLEEAIEALNIKPIERN